MAQGSTGFQPRNTPAERRAFFEQLRRLKAAGGGGGGASYPPNGATGTVLAKASPADDDVYWAPPAPKGDTGATGPPGTPGADGADGADSTVPGPPGPGVAAGGTTGQVLTKVNATDYNTTWQNAVSDTLWVGTSAPTEPSIELWYDTDEVAPALPLPSYGLEAAKPATSPAGSRYFATDTMRDWLYDGTGWIIMGEPPQTWTPTFASGVTVGTGTRTGSYHRSDGWIDIRGEFLLASGSTITGSVSLNLPIPFGELNINQLKVVFMDASLFYGGFVNNQAAPGFYAMTASGAYASIAVLSATVPFAWAATHRMQFDGRYRMNSRYS